jgi:hypothetical protein
VTQGKNNRGLLDYEDAEIYHIDAWGYTGKAVEHFFLTFCTFDAAFVEAWRVLEPPA